MFARASSALLLALPFLSAIAAAPATGQCNTGSLQCCNTVEQSGQLSPDTTALLGLLGVVIGDITAAVGVTCTPISVIGIGGNSCTAQPVCCTNNNFSGLVALGCTPINLNL